MKRFILCLLCVATCVTGSAQYSSHNSFSRRQLVCWEKDVKGFYHPSTNVIVETVSNVVEEYAYDKKSQALYVLTPNSNAMISLTKEYAKIIKKNKYIPQLSDEALASEISKKNKFLEEKFLQLNQLRQQQISDSIHRAQQDSIERIRILNARQAEERARKAQQEQDRINYMKEHNFRDVPLGSESLKCTICGSYINPKNVYCTWGVKNDSIYYATKENGDLGLAYFDHHQSVIPSRLKKNEQFKYHYQVFKDSLTSDTIDYALMNKGMNYLEMKDYISALKKKAPYGYFKDWGWEAEFSMLTFYFKYVNTNKNTIKYITVYFKITNGVNDVRKTGYFQGTGPLEEGETASWNWDSSSYFLAGDASEMSITKVVINYMNGTKRVLTGNNIVFHRNEVSSVDELSSVDDQLRVSDAYDVYTPAEIDDSKVFTSVEQMPQFPGGDAALLKYIDSHLQYPAMAQEQGIQGKCVLQFVVTKTGSVGEVKVVRSLSPDCDNEAKRVVRGLPKFTPGKQNGQAVNVWYTLPVTFKLQN